MNVVELNPNKSVKESLEHFLERADHFDCVLLLAINSDGTLYLKSSEASGMQKCTMVAFAQNYINNWFSEIL